MPKAKSTKKTPAKQPTTNRPAPKRPTRSIAAKKQAANASDAAPRAARGGASKTGAVRYDVHPGVAQMRAWAADLPSKTCRSLAQWIALVKKDGPADEAAQREWLKTKHGLGTNSAWWIAERAAGRGSEDDDPDAYLRAAATWVDAMYANKPALRPLHDALVALGRSMGRDVGVCPCKTIVPFYRAHVFAQIKPSTRTRIDFGLALGDAPATGRLIDTGGFAKKDRITHRFEITSEADIDDEVVRWTRVAYQRDG